MICDVGLGRNDAEERDDTVACAVSAAGWLKRECSVIDGGLSLAGSLVGETLAIGSLSFEGVVSPCVIVVVESDSRMALC